MRYGILSDIHSNLEALESVLADFSKEKIDKYICVGDIIGYGADPRACIRIVRDLDPLVVLGNHEAGCIGQIPLSYFNENAKIAVSWTRKRLAPAYLEYLKKLEFVTRERKDFTVVHGTLIKPEEFAYMSNSSRALVSFRKLQSKILFVGHSHVSGVFEFRNSKAKNIAQKNITLFRDTKYIVNVGSVGQPRDGDVRASYAIYDTRKKSISIRRAVYDIKTAQRKILKAGLPPALADRLELGI